MERQLRWCQAGLAFLYNRFGTSKDTKPAEDKVGGCDLVDLLACVRRQYGPAVMVVGAGSHAALISSSKSG